MDQITMEHMVIISIITVILFSIVYDPYAIVYVIGAISILLAFVKTLTSKKKDVSKFIGKTNMSEELEVENQMTKSDSDPLDYTERTKSKTSNVRKRELK